MNPQTAFQQVKPLLSRAVQTEIEQRLAQFQTQRVAQSKPARARQSTITTPMVMRPLTTPRPLNRSYFTL